MRLRLYLIHVVLIVVSYTVHIYGESMYMAEKETSTENIYLIIKGAVHLSTREAEALRYREPSSAPPGRGH